MSIEKQLGDLLEALKENTAAHRELARVAVHTSGQTPAEPEEGKTPAPAAQEEPEQEEKASESAKKKSEASRKAAETRKKNKEKAEEAKKAEEPADEPAESDGAQAATVVPEIAEDDLRSKCRTWMSDGDDNERDRRKGLLKAALDHIGAANLSGLHGEGRARLASYIEAWEAGSEKIDFEAIDAKVEEARESEDDPTA